VTFISKRSILAGPELVWSRDGNFILAPAVNAPDGWAVYDGNQIYSFPVDGGTPWQLTYLKGHALHVRPSTDGSPIASPVTNGGQSYTM
jgi:hypothetical protein